MTSLLDFYRQHGISPVHQDITDRPAHFARRAALYRSLGLPPMAVKGRHVLEVGAGSAANAWYTISLEPATFEILEPNETGAAELEADIGALALVQCVRVEDFRAYRPFDLVLCEGLLGLCGTDPKALLESVARHVAPGGVLVITCIDAISDHAEVLRRAIAQRLIDRTAPLAEQVAVLRRVFTPHLATLKGMTRSVDDWIIDNLLNPASIGPTFSIPDACEALDGRFDVLGCSPRFLMDWRWYKDAPEGNQWAIDAYWEQCHNLLDYRRIMPRWTDNRRLMARCQSFREALLAFERGDGAWPVDDSDHIMQSPSWFGRGQQYLSFVRR